MLRRICCDYVDVLLGISDRLAREMFQLNKEKKVHCFSLSCQQIEGEFLNGLQLMLQDQDFLRSLNHKAFSILDRVNIKFSYVYIAKLRQESDENEYLPKLKIAVGLLIREFASSRQSLTLDYFRKRLGAICACFSEVKITASNRRHYLEAVKSLFTFASAQLKKYKPHQYSDEVIEICQCWLFNDCVKKAFPEYRKQNEQKLAVARLVAGVDPKKSAHLYHEVSASLMEQAKIKGMLAAEKASLHDFAFEPRSATVHE